MLYDDDMYEVTIFDKGGFKAKDFLKCLPEWRDAEMTEGRGHVVVEIEEEMDVAFLTDQLDEKGFNYDVS